MKTRPRLPTSRRHAFSGLLWLLIVSGLASAQKRGLPPEQQGHPDEGKVVALIEVKGARDPESVRRQLKTQVDKPLRAADIANDINALWRRLKVMAKVFTEDAGEGRVKVIFEVRESRGFDRIEFRGLHHFTQKEVRRLLGITSGQRLTEHEAVTNQRSLETRYRRDGYYFVAIQIIKDDEKSLLVFAIDEGDKVAVRHVHFRGNKSFPGWAPLALYQNLVGSAKMESAPAGKILHGAAFSETAVEEDLDKLRVFYRRLGYRDARVELARRQFTRDRNRVDLDFLVIEGPRYRISKVDLEFVDTAEGHPIYPKAKILQNVHVKPGDYYNRDDINRDKRAIQRFYGKRGHPTVGRFGRAQIPDSFRVLEPSEIFDTEKAEVNLVYRVLEGTPKTLRDVVITGNTDTRDSVIRRKVFLFPGQTLDTTKLEKSLQSLDALRYFQDPNQLSAVRLELLPVEGQPDEVDLKVGVAEGDTGSLRWGAGVSTGAGIVAQVSLTKRNFDISRPPSSFNPITIVDEVIHNKAFHGGGQEMNIFLAPGTEISTFRIELSDPDLFGQHFDTIGGRLQGFRVIRILESFDSDALGAIVGLQRNFSEDLTAGVFFREETVNIKNVDSNAPTIVFDKEGKSEIRGVGFTMRMRKLDNPRRPTKGFQVDLSGSVAGGPFGASEDFFKVGAGYRYYYPLFRDSSDRAHVLHVRQRFDFGKAFGDSEDLFLTERFYLGGSTLRGFDQRRVGPTQFGEPLGGEARLTTTVEYQFPLVSTRLQSRLRETELIRGVFFSDFGLLGTRINDPTFSDVRLSVGFGLRIFVPYLGFPIALDLGIPLFYEETDDRRPFFFTLGRF